MASVLGRVSILYTMHTKTAVLTVNLGHGQPRDYLCYILSDRPTAMRYCAQYYCHCGYQHGKNPLDIISSAICRKCNNGGNWLGWLEIRYFALIGHLYRIVDNFVNIIPDGF